MKWTPGTQPLGDTPATTRGEGIKSATPRTKPYTLLG
jgi:hypothetical protein